MAPSFQVGEYHLSPARVLLRCGFCDFREPAAEARAGLDEDRWTELEPPMAYRCRQCGRLRYVDESLEIKSFDLSGFPVEPVKVA